MPNPLATWNPDRDCWETEVVDIFGHSDVYSETWPTSGMTRNGVAYALPTWAPPITASASSSSPPAKTFRTPAAAEAEGGPRDRNRPGATMRLSDQVREEMEDGNLRVLKTPTSQLAVNGGSQHPDKRRAGGHGPTLADEVEHLLPTPLTSDTKMSGPADLTRNTPQLRAVTDLLPTPVAQPSGNSPEEHLRKKPGRTVVTDLAILMENGLLPTGGRIPKPSTAGNPSWEDAPLPLPNSPTGESTACPPASPNG